MTDHITEDQGILDDVLPDDPPSLIKRVLVIIAGIFLVVLVISLLFVSYPLSSVIEGKIESEPMQGNKIHLADFSIIFEEKVAKDLRSIYFSDQKQEFSLCLLGKKYQDDYHINSFYQPTQFSQTFNQVIFEKCSEDTLIILHTHPYKSCLASETDINTLKKTQEKNSNVLMVVMCEPGRFSVYS